MVTYELYLQFDDGRRVFEPVLCAHQVELFETVRRLVDERGAASIEARLMNEVLFVVGR